MRTIVALGLMMVGFAGCSTKPKELYVDHAWVRLGAIPGNPAAAYFNVHGGPDARTLIDVTTDVAIRAEMHESTGGAMKSLANVAIPADTVVRFEPGGRHVMLFQMNPGIKPGGTLTLTLSFANGERIMQKAGVIGAGDPTPK